MRKLIIALLVLAVAGAGYFAFRPVETVNTDFNPMATVTGRAQLHAARGIGGVITLSDRVSVERRADGSMIVTVRKTLAEDWDYDDEGRVVLKDVTLPAEGSIDLSSLDLNGPIKSIEAGGGQVVITGWAKEPVVNLRWENDSAVFTFPSSLAKEMGAGKKETKATDTADEAEATGPKITVEPAQLAAVILQEAGITASWKEKKLSGDALTKRVETFETLAAVRTGADPNYNAGDGSAAGLYGMTAEVVAEAYTAKAIKITLSGDYTGKGEPGADAAELLRRMQGNADLANKVAVAYWLHCESQAFASDPSAQAEFNARTEAWCSIALVEGVAAMRSRIEAPAAEEPLDDPLLQEMQPWYSSLGVYHDAYPVH